MKKFFDTLSVFVANLLRLKPSSWEASEKQAVAMRVTAQQFIAGNIKDSDGKVKTQTPIGYLANATLNALAFVVAIWVITQIINAFLLALPFLIGIAFVMWLLGTFAKPKAPATAS